MSARLPYLPALALTCLLWLAAEPPAHATPPSVADYEKALAAERLAPPSARDLEELSEELERAQQQLLAQRKAQAAEILMRVTDGPRFREFRDFDEFQNAEYMLAGTLLDLGAKLSARRYLERVLTRGPQSPYFGPAFRRLVDVALSTREPDALLKRLEQLAGESPIEDASWELAYLRGRLAYLRDDYTAAAASLEQVGERSRFHASALYLLGAMAAERKRYAQAEQRFCAITEAGKDDRYSFFVDDRYFPVRDLAHLGLGRVTHEVGRNEDAFYYYFQVPQDSPRLEDALFEAAYTSYEGGNYDAALDALDQLDARAPHSVFSTEGALLRGYLHLSRCEFSDAERQLVRFQKRFVPLVREIDGILDSPARQRSLYDDLVARERDRQRIEREQSGRDPSPDSALLALLRVDPEFYALHRSLDALEQEAARAGRIPGELDAVANALEHGKTPTRARPDDDPVAERRQLEARLDQLRQGIGALSEELGHLRRGGADAQQLAELREEIRALDAEALALTQALHPPAQEAGAEAATETPAELVPLLRADRAHTANLLAEVDGLRQALLQRADELATEGLRKLRESLAQQLRRARIGRIDAVMGAKRRLELQVESLAAGRFPPELADPLRMQSLLRDDEEYWPFEGEDWPDEFVESYVPEEEP